MSEGLNPWELVKGASLIVQIVMGLLLIASIVSWSIMLRKRGELRRARADADRFEEVFWSGGDLTAMFRAIDQGRRVTKGMEAIFEQGFREFSRMRQQGGFASAQLIEGSRRGMRVALLKESDRLEQSLSMLATVGSTSPYVGLFGTVWGIMNAFHGLGNVQQATLAMVAPGIAEALIATAMGLFAAIPAVIAYNRYADQVSRIELRYDTFVEELSTILQRHATERRGGQAAAEAHA
ncbi:MAG TPA: protein TolQ [Steroidobacteraceae bacterium]|nr:protein TolQ [Steroidobacteraceae bacterium]